MFSKKIWAFLLFVHLAPLASASTLPDFTDLVEKTGSAVVNISTTQTISNARMNFPFGHFEGEGPAFEFFRHFFPEEAWEEVPREYQNKSLGSGFIISQDGYILTNAHVVSEADEISVRLTDKREFKAEVIGMDRRTDVALLKIAAQNLPIVKQAKSDSVKVGEWVVAIGSPFGFDNSVTAGIVSAKGRSLPQENYVPFIQTDVAINPGNSGGPLFNMQGEVIGINSQIYSRSGGYMGVSFAIPIEVAMEIQGQLRQSGKVSRGRLGVVIQDLTPDLANNLGLKTQNGALVNMVEDNAPAKNVLRAGDVITHFNGKAIEKSADLPRQVAALPPGSEVNLGIVRAGKSQNVTVRLGEMSENSNFSKRKTPKKSAQNNRFGLGLSPLNAAQKERLGLPHGLKVEEVRGSLLKGNLKRGDIILSLIHQGKETPAHNVADFAKAMDALPPNDSFTLLVRRGEMQMFITLKENKK